MSAEVRLKARHPAGSFLVQAPAGSGKTELLSQRILALLAIVDEPEEVLALTFTRKAAAEMRTRVLESLMAAKPDASASHKMETWKLAQQVMLRSEEKGWHLTAHPTRLRIMTLDSLTYSIARQLPLLSGFGDMPTPSEHAQRAYREAAEAALNETMRDFSDAAEYVLLHLDHNAVTLIALLADMLGKREQWLDEIAMHGRDMGSLRLMLEQNLADIMMHKLDACDALMPIDVKAALPGLMRFAGEQKKNELLQQVGEWPKASLDLLPQWQLIANFLLTASGPDYRKAGGVTVRLGFPAGKAFADEKDQFKLLLDTLAGGGEQALALATLLHEIRQMPDSAAIDSAQWQVLESLFLLLVLANKHLQIAVGRQGEADFTEIALRAMEALGANDAVPGDLLMKLDYRIHHILVDEFQDTSYLQMRLLQCLTAGWQEGDGIHRSLFMVGDPMQSIYRFRKAEVGLFLNAANNAAGLPLVEALQLERNFRSAPAIVDWVNRAFQCIFPAVQDVISGAVVHAPAVAALAHEGSVNLHIQHAKNADVEAETVRRLVQQALATPSAKGDPQRIGILARSRKHLHAIMQSLQLAGIAFRAINILPLHARPEVRLLRALLRALLHPADRESWATILRAPCCGLESYDMAVLLAGHDQPVWSLLQDDDLFQQLSMDAQARIRSIRTILEPCLAMSGKVAVMELLQTAWLRLSMPAMIDASASLNVDATLALIGSLEQGGRIDFAQLDERLEKLYATPDASASAAQVELMTMHGAKGSQWDVVILPGLGNKGANVDTPLLAFSEVPVAGGAMPLMAVKASTRQKDALYSMVSSVEKSKDNNELQRLLYVACTRAETHLHLLGHVSEVKGAATTGSLLHLLLSEDEGGFGAHMWNVEAGDQSIAGNPLGLKRVSHALDVSAVISDDAEQVGMHDQEVEYVWAGAEAAPVGNAVHAALQHIAQLGIEHWSDEHTQRELNMLNRTLIAEGLSGGMLKAASIRCAEGLQRVLSSEKARWILSDRHQDAHAEWALSSECDGFISHNIIDRSFIDEQGIRWIIDYKTASHEGGSLEVFLKEEVKRHTSQLQRYALILKNREPKREIRAALYFPMLDAWSELDLCKLDRDSE
ncbi:MAG: UvrD-helicase domain-containing protein [Mariprofundus sp.]|nr:UvrD-helicase domain-containing protein [Mariprofundus sp.]